MNGTQPNQDAVKSLMGHLSGHLSVEEFQRRYGVSAKDIALYFGVTQNTVSNWKKQGAAPAHERALYLLAMHLEVQRKAFHIGTAIVAYAKTHQGIFGGGCSSAYQHALQQARK